ncbi:response regulator [Catalinimonas niigatensis]|uniref:response regulator n=1 Tax=Catalinimonas niigatensis TaxID=1397264 RepID=UPI0026653AF7|nr:response regulator transcription factor [Catalinimonas niigatensis]WPP53085.1 response regulator transcription factor [Catalinimonas niigatensis]
MDKINILLVDDHQIIRDGIKLMLQDNEFIRIAEEASNVSEALAILERQNNVSLIISDISLPKQDGLDLLKIVKKEYEGLQFLFLSMYIEEHYALQAVEYGADGYLPKDVSVSTLVNAIKTIHEGDIYYDKKISDLIIKAFINKNIRRYGVGESSRSLTKREKEILGLVIDGVSNSIIADKLEISVRTVENHRANILRKVGVKNTAELVRYTLQHDVLN